MRLKDGFILREVAGQIIILSISSEFDANHMMTVNDTGRFIWEKLKNDITNDQLVDLLLEEYDVDEETATASVKRFTERLIELGVLE